MWSFSLVVYKFQPYLISQIEIAIVPITVKKKFLLELRDYLLFLPSPSLLVFGQDLAWVLQHFFVECPKCDVSSLAKYMFKAMGFSVRYKRFAQLCESKLFLPTPPPHQGAEQNWNLLRHAQESFKREQLQNSSPYETEW